MYIGITCRKCDIQRARIKLKVDIQFKQSEQGTFKWDILNFDRLINLEINNKRRTSIILSGDYENEEIKH